tara:strand:- start:339 stop:659 length:321 start_codon:yes stop_codon:yes gene_type:complete
MNTKLVYSTDRSVNIKENVIKEVDLNPSEQKVYLHLERKGGGKILSIVKGLKHPKQKLIALAKELKKQCGVGGTVKNNEILIQGNFRGKIKSILSKKGYNVKLSGG